MQITLDRSKPLEETNISYHKEHLVVNIFPHKVEYKVNDEVIGTDDYDGKSNFIIPSDIVSRFKGTISLILNYSPNDEVFELVRIGPKIKKKAKFKQSKFDQIKSFGRK